MTKQPSKKTTPHPPASGENHLAEWLSDPRADVYFGRTFRLRFEMLVALLSGETAASVGRRCNVSKQAASVQSKRARAIYGFMQRSRRN